MKLLLANMILITNDLLSHAFTSQTDIEVVGTATEPSDLDEILAEQVPDVALVGTRGAKDDSTAYPFLARIAALSPNTRQVVLARTMERENVVEFFRLGVRGLLCGTRSDVALTIKCVRCVAKGEIWVSGHHMELLVRSLSFPQSCSVLSATGEPLLSKREEQVLQLLTEGLSNRELAQRLSLSEHTVKNHIFRIYDKLGISSRTEAVIYAVGQRERNATATPLVQNRMDDTRGGRGASTVSDSAHNPALHGS